MTKGPAEATPLAILFDIDGCLISTDGSLPSTRAKVRRNGGCRPVDPATVIVVGDTPRDIDAAHFVKAVAVGVATGTYTGAELRAAGADYVLATLEEPLPGVAEAPLPVGRNR